MDIATASTSRHLSRWIAARQMALTGFVTQIIQIETGLSYKQVRRVYAEIAEEGLIIERKSRTPRTGHALINSLNSKLQASVLMQVYRNIAGDGVMQSVDIKALCKSFKLYHATRRELGIQNDKRWAAFDITDAWSLAAELRNGEAFFEHCKSCNMSFFTSINQSSKIDCPFCHGHMKAPYSLQKCA